METSSTQRVRQYRSKFYAKGLRPIQIWIPDMQTKEFLKESIRQSHLVSDAEKQDQDLEALLDEALVDLIEKS